ncbi:MAG: membrane protein insertion efficiency factor YidD [Clostridia bacterium]|nr:membrane protein insertion efficiency factor YidD [Clostridia bacterium]
MKHICIGLIRFYQKFLSPLKRNPSCRFYPSCSAYAIQAFQKRGFFAGLILTVYRILRCNPFCAPGYDPVPDKGFRHHQIPEDEQKSEKGVLKYRRPYEQ